MSARKSSHGTIFLIVSSGSPLALIASSLRSKSKKLFCPMTRSLPRYGQRVRFAATWREEFFEAPCTLSGVVHRQVTRQAFPYASTPLRIDRRYDDPSPAAQDRPLKCIRPSSSAALAPTSF